MLVCWQIFHWYNTSRVTDSNSTLIDHITTSCHTYVQEVVQTCGLSDHHVQIATLQYRTVKTVPIELTTFDHFDTVTGISFVVF